MSEYRITLDLDRDGWTNGYQVSINRRDEKGAGDGYRLLGSQFNGSSKPVATVILSARDRDEIRAYLDQIPDDEDDS
jgi:hypothetical protein